MCVALNATIYASCYGSFLSQCVCRLCKFSLNVKDVPFSIKRSLDGFDVKREYLYGKLPTNLRGFGHQEGVLLLTSKVPLVSCNPKEMSGMCVKKTIQKECTLSTIQPVDVLQTYTPAVCKWKKCTKDPQPVDLLRICASCL